MTTWKLIALDMDGTLLGVNEDISHATRKAIAKAKAHGISVTLATGRLFSPFVREVVDLLHLDAPVVTVNGGEVWSPDGQLLFQAALPMADVDMLAGLVQTEDLTFWACPSMGEPVHRETWPADYRGMTWLKFGYHLDTAEAAIALRARLEHVGRFEVTNSSPFNVEINPKGVTKATGLAYVCEQLGASPSEVVAIGDSLNDVPMLQWAGLGIAMGNAQDEVKAVARRVTTHHMHDGVAAAIEQLLA